MRIIAAVAALFMSLLPACAQQPLTPLSFPNYVKSAPVQSPLIGNEIVPLALGPTGSCNGVICQTTTSAIANLVTTSSLLNTANIWLAVNNFSVGLKLGGGTTVTSVSGNSGKLQTVVGSVINGGCPSGDSNGNIIWGAGPCISSSSGVSAGTIGQAAYYASTGSVVSGTSVGALTYTATNSTTARAGNSRANDHGVNILDFGADPTGSADSSAAIQAAIDSLAGSNSPINTIFCPAGAYKTTVPIFLDRPGNLRGSDGTNGNTFDPGAIYQLNDTANSGGIAYISLTPGGQVGHTPPNATYWRPFLWSSSTTYNLNDVASFQGVPWISLVNSNLNNTPTAASGNSTFWRPYYLTQSGFGGSPGGGSNFSFALTGPEGLGWGAPSGCKIAPTFNNGVWLIVGIGQRMTVRNIALSGAVSCYHAQCDPNGIGIGIAGDSGGSQNALIENVNISGPIYTLSETSFNVDGLGAETTWRKMYSGNCFNGIIINGSQNFINHVEDSNIGCIHDVISVKGPGIDINGGAIGTEGSQAPVNASFTVSGTSNLVPNNPLGYWIYGFTTTITPGSTGSGCFPGTSTPYDCISGCNPQGGCVFNRWVFPTAHFGPIPATPTTYNSSTHVMTFLIEQDWANWNFAGGSVGGSPPSADTVTDINAELQAVTTAWATEGTTMFEGLAFTVRHVHVENSPTCLQLYYGHGISGDTGSIFERIFFNYDMTNVQAGIPNAAWYCQQSFPFINGTNSGSYRLDQNRFALANGGLGASNTPLIIDAAQIFGSCVFGRQGVAAYNYTVRIPNLSGGPNPGPGSQCQFDDPTFMPTGFNFPGGMQNDQLVLSQQNLPQIGWFQGPGNAYLTPGQFTTLSSVAGNLLSSYPPINGGQVYTVLNNSGYYTGATTPSAAKLVQSNHAYYSWGQDITTSVCSGLSWAYKGQTNAVLADGCTLGVVFPGLGITLDNGSGPQHYMVSAVFPNTSLDGGTHPGYFTVLIVPFAGVPNNLLVGTKTTVYTCPGSCPSTKIGQDAFSWKTLTLQ